MSPIRLLGSVMLLGLSVACVGGTSLPATLESTGEPVQSAGPTTEMASAATPTASALDLLTAVQNGTIEVAAKTGAEGSRHIVHLLIRNRSGAVVEVKSPAGLLLGDANPETVDLLLPSIAAVEVPPGADVSLSLPAYQAAYTYPERAELGSNAEVTGQYFVNHAPGPEAALSILELSTALGPILEAADLDEAAAISPAAQLAILAAASDIRAGRVGFCGSDVVYTGTILENAVQGGTRRYWYYQCGAAALPADFPSLHSEEFGVTRELVQQARDILRKAAGMNPELATPFRIALRPTHPALADEQVRAALVALIDQERLVEQFGFAATFHFVESAPPAEGGIASLPEISAGGMSPSDAQAVIQEWVAANGPLEFRLSVETGDPFAIFATLVQDDWMTAGADPVIFVQEAGVFYPAFFEGDFEAAVEHRPGLLP